MDESTVTTASNPVPHRNYFVDLLVILFGIGSWIGVTSSYLQLPVIVESAPEGWSLPSYMALSVQLANIAPFAYVIYQKYSPRKFNDANLIYITLLIGCVGAVCMAFFYQKTTVIAGQERSLAFLVITFIFALVGCMSSVLFMPYMGRFREIYLVTYLCGQGLNGFLSSILALIQGVGGNPECIPTNSTNGTIIFEKYISPPRFSVQIFFLCVLAVMILSTIAFVLLDNLKVCKREYAAGTVSLGNEYHYDQVEKENELHGDIPDNVRNLSTFNYIFLFLVVIVLNCLGNGIFPSIQSYSSLSYGNLAYHLSTTMSAIANPLACFVAFFLPHLSITSVRALFVCAAALATYIFYTALESPYPPMQNSFAGVFLIVFCWATFTGIINFTKLSITTIFRYQEGKSLVVVGTVAQISSAFGALIGFLLVNVFNVFTSYQPC